MSLRVLLLTCFHSNTNKHTHRHRQIHCRDHTESTRYRGYMQPNRARRKRGATCRACCVAHLCPPGQICAHRTFVHITTASIQHNSTSRTTQQQRATIHTNTITIRIHAQQHIRTHVLGSCVNSGMIDKVCQKCDLLLMRPARSSSCLFLSSLTRLFLSLP